MYLQPDDNPYQPYNPERPNVSPERSSRSLRARGTNPALPDVTMPTAPVAPVVPALAPSMALPTAAPNRRQHPARRASWKLLALGILLALVIIFLYPLLATALSGLSGTQPVMSAWTGEFPWITHLYWTAWLPAARFISHLPMFDVSQPGGSANLLLLGFAIFTGLYLLAARVARNMGRERLSTAEARLLLWIICALAALFGLLFLFAPALMSQDALLYGLYGRMVTIYHVNPYVMLHAIIPLSDPLRNVLTGQVGQPAFGPVWMDVSLTVSLTARNGIASVLFDFRLLALVVHLVNTLLIWNLLARLKQEARFTGTLLYAWNPAVLLLGISEMRFELVVILFVLLALLFFQRRALVLSWVCLLLAILILPLCLLLLPIFIRLIVKVTRGQPTARRAGWWLAVIAMSVVILALAYAPYFVGWSVAGIASQLRLAFMPDAAMNSLDVAVQHLRFSSLPAIAWLAAPLTWTILAAIVTLCLLLLGMLLTENLEYALLFSAWIYLALLVLAPTYLAWYVSLPLVLAICSTNARTTLLALLLAGGALLSYYFNLFAPPWESQALITIGLPILVWGWSLFLSSTLQMTHMQARASSQHSGQLPAIKSRGPRFSRPPWLSRP